MSDEGVPNYDWAREIAESTTDTIDRHLPGGLLLYFTDYEVEQLHIAIRRIIAAELLKLEHRYKARIVAMQPANIAYQLKSRAEDIAAWEPIWEVTVQYREGSPDVYPAIDYEQAVEECRNLSTMPNVLDASWRMR